MMINFFLNFLFPPIIFLLGLLGNTFGLIVIGRKQLDKIGPILIYKFLFTMDSIYLSSYMNINILKLFFYYLSF
jgi:hypothetical protein